MKLKSLAKELLEKFESDSEVPSCKKTVSKWIEESDVALGAGSIANFNTVLGLVVASLLWGLAGLGLAPASPAFFSAAGHIPGVSTAWAVSFILHVTIQFVLRVRAVTYFFHISTSARIICSQH